MAIFTKTLLSGSTNGRGIKVVATATAGTTIHTTGISSSVMDEVWLWAYNDGAVEVLLTIEFGGTTDPDDLIVQPVPAGTGLFLVVPGLPLTGTGSTGSIVGAFADTANVITLYGFVNRIG